MPLTPTRSWGYSLATPAVIRPVSEESESTLSAVVTTIGIFAAATIGAFLTHLPPVGFIVGGVGAFAVVSGLASHSARNSSTERCTLVLGADGFRVNDEFHSWLGVRGVNVSDGLIIELFNGTKWHLQTNAADEIAEHAKTRTRWALRAPSYRRRMMGGYRTSACTGPSHRTGLPEALRMSTALSKRLEDFRRLDNETKLQVLEAMADYSTRRLYLDSTSSELLSQTAKLVTGC